MKFLLVSDLHYALKQFDWTVAAAPAVDVVVLAGDHIDIVGQLDGGVQTVVILKYLRKLAAHGAVIASSGNHDLDRRDASGEKIAFWMEKVRAIGVTTDGDTLTLGDTMLGETLVTVCPWWDGPNAKALVEAQFARDEGAVTRDWIWVYHSPPEGSPTAWNGRRDCGDADLRRWIERYQPRIVFTGHIHEAPFKSAGSWVDRIGETWVFNCGRQHGPEPTHIFVDTNAGEAVWFSQAGAEHVKLGAPLERPVAELAALPSWLPASILALDRSPA